MRGGKKEPQIGLLMSCQYVETLPAPPTFPDAYSPILAAAEHMRVLVESQASYRS